MVDEQPSTGDDESPASQVPPGESEATDPKKRTKKVLLLVGAWIVTNLTALAMGVVATIVGQKVNDLTEDDIMYSADASLSDPYFFPIEPSRAQMQAAMQADFRQPEKSPEESLTVRSRAMGRLGGLPTVGAVKVTFFNPQSQPIIITAGYARITRRETRTFAASLVDHSLGGDGGAASLLFDLSRNYSPAHFICDQNTPCEFTSDFEQKQAQRSYFSIRNVRVEPNQSYAIVAIPHNGTGYIEWHLEFDIQQRINGERVTKHLIVQASPRGEFRGVGNKQTAKHRYAFMRDQSVQPLT
ncbi:hypothetical protein [Fodinicola acaciae]|uniref:hypothetical protein n=1 Tax=Fodinicola acaciae TaxID=2681555 RepID=UPI0013D2A1FB|nr:hypothetical protein [Fodinicola acaciae]